MWPEVMICHVLLSVALSNNQRYCCRSPGDDFAASGSEVVYKNIIGNKNNVHVYNNVVIHEKSVCNSVSTCVLFNESVVTGIAEDECRVRYDTKIDSDHLTVKQECLRKNFKSRRNFLLELDQLPFYIHAYPFLLNGSLVTAMDLRFHYNLYQKLRFRFKNTNPDVCPKHHIESSDCNPRCVEIDKSGRSRILGAVDNIAYLSYDCELGFYREEATGTRVDTSNDTYELSVCAWEDKDDHEEVVCGEFVFQLPPPDKVNVSREDHHVLLLVDKKEYDNNDQVVVHIPTSHVAADQYLVSLLLVHNGTRFPVYNQTENIPYGVGKTLKVTLDTQIPSGDYQIAVIPMRGGVVIAEPSLSSLLVRPSYGAHALVIISFCFIALCGGMGAGAVYKTWADVAEEGALDPSLEVERGRREPVQVLFTTPLDNHDHVEVVRRLCKYLRDWCGVSKTYFALDEELGIVASGKEAWDWCRDVGDVIRRDGVVVYVAGPDPEIVGTSGPFSHPLVGHKQPFFTASQLDDLVSAGRVIVIKFLYSDMATIPAEVPPDLVQKAYLLPRKTNQFLCHLLQIKKLEFGICLKEFVWPEIYPGDLEKEGGLELVEKIHSICLKKQHFYLNLAEQRYGTPIDRLIWNRRRPILGSEDTLVEF